MEKNRTKILMGLIFVSAVNSDKTSSIGAREKAKINIAPNKAIIQYVLKVIFPILNLGKKNNDAAINRNVDMEMMIVGIIGTKCIIYLLYAFVNNLFINL